MKEHPILFSTPMVQGILEEYKSMTRTRRTKGLEVINKNPDEWQFIGDSRTHDVPNPADNDLTWYQWTKITNNSHTFIAPCPYGKEGDILWVREMFYAYGHWTRVTTTLGNLVKKEYHFNDLTLSDKKKYLYEDCPPDLILKRWGLGYHKRPSIFMPKAACRIKLEITSTRVERLNNISSNDAQWEGNPENGEPFVLRFKELWISINGKGSWDNNPWVWVIEFENIKQELRKKMKKTYGQLREHLLAVMDFADDENGCKHNPGISKGKYWNMLIGCCLDHEDHEAVADIIVKNTLTEFPEYLAIS